MINKKIILFRADSSSTIGTGHIMRDLVLAKQYEDATIIFATQKRQGNINHKIIEAGYTINILNTNSIEELDTLIKKHNVDLLVIDHYEIDYMYEKQLKLKNPNMQLMVFDDTYEKHYCDILYNHNIYSDEKKYIHLVPSFCELRCGAKYTLLREEFYEAKKQSKMPNAKCQIFLAMGGADTANLNIPILEVLKELPNITVNIVTTTGNKHLKELKEYVKNKSWITLHVNAKNIATLMRESDFGIITPSVTANEAYFMELPFVAIKTADNQNKMVAFLEKNGYMTCSNFAQLQEHLKNIFTIKLLNFTKLSLDEKKMILAWRNTPNVRKWMFHQEIINFTNHIKYIASLKNKTDKLYFLIKHYNTYLGVIDFTNITAESAEIGLYANPNIRGVGSILMGTLISYGFKELHLKRLLAVVFSDNKKAIKLYRKFNFREIGKKIVNEKEVICMELENENR